MQCLPHYPRRGKLSLGWDSKSPGAESGCETQLVVPLANGLTDPRLQRTLCDEGWEPDKQLPQQDQDGGK